MCFIFPFFFLNALETRITRQATSELSRLTFFLAVRCATWRLSLPAFFFEFRVADQSIVRMQTDERIARVALQWSPAGPSPGRGSGMQIAAARLPPATAYVVRKGRYVTQPSADRA